MRYIVILLVWLLTACVSQPQPGIPDRDDFDPIAAAKTRISLGLTYLKNGNYSQAKFNLDKALQFAPRFADAHYSIAYYYQVVGENELAEASYQEALERAPRNADIANTYGAFLCQQGKYQQAKQYFLKAVNSQNYVSTAETYENLALCSQSQGYSSEAIEYLQLALNHQPSRSKSMFMLAQLYASEGEWQAARDVLRKYERIARVSPETLWLSVKIEQALGNDEVARGYGDMLISMYPKHPNTQDYLRRRVSRAETVDKPQQASSAPVAHAVVAEPQAPASDVAVVTQSPPVERPDDTESLPDNDAQSSNAVNNEATVTEPEPAKELAQTASTAVAQDAETPLNKDAPPRYHTVQKDENLYRISLLYNIRMQRLIEWNQLDDASAIYTGKKLLLVDPETIE